MVHMLIIPETESVRSQFVGNWIRKWKNEKKDGNHGIS